MARSGKGRFPMVLFHLPVYSRLVAGTALSIALLAAAPALCESLVERGDTLHVSITDAPKLGGDSKVDADGRIVLPQLGGIPVAGLGLEAIKARIEELLVKRDILKSPSVLVEIAKYRPFYVGGKVKRPGAIDYEPGLTVRHSLILAGGADLAVEDRLSPTAIADLSAKWKAGSYQLFQVNSRIARLEAELVRKDRVRSPVATGGVPAQDVQTMIGLDQNILHDRLETWTGSQAHLREGMALFDLEIDVLTKQADLQKKELAIDKDQVENARKLVDKGLLPLPRLQDLQHEESRSSRDLLENQAFIARARQNRASVEYELDSADIKWRIDIRQQLREAMLDRVRLKAELEVVSAQILDAGITLEGNAAKPQTDVVIYRSAEGREETIKAQMDTEVLPGDILEVSLSPGPAG
jgi:polysaccharide export outer membrane protein